MVVGIDLDGQKDVLVMWIGENEYAKFWLSVFMDLKSRGVQDILVVSTDNLRGFTEVLPDCQNGRHWLNMIRRETIKPMAEMSLHKIFDRPCDLRGMDES